MKNILNTLKRYIKLPVIDQNKANHFIYGIVIYYIFKLTASIVFNSLIGILTGSIIGIVAAVGKKIYDKKHPNHVSSWQDAVYTIAGVVLGIIITLL